MKSLYRQVARSLALLLMAVRLPRWRSLTAPTWPDRSQSGELPPVESRIPEEPLIVELREDQSRRNAMAARCDSCFGRSKDIRMMMVYGYARLMGYTPELNLEPDILKDFTVENERVFTFHLRKGHRWSDGAPFTAEAFRYYWEDIVNNEESLSLWPAQAIAGRGQAAAIRGDRRSGP